MGARPGPDGEQRERLPDLGDGHHRSTVPGRPAPCAPIRRGRPPAKPTRDASRTRRSRWGTSRTSPARPTSPIHAVSEATARSVSDDATATHTARSAAGSLMRTPPAAETNTSQRPTGRPRSLSSTPLRTVTRLGSSPLTERRGRGASPPPPDARVTSACTSVSSGRRPSTAGTTADPGSVVAAAAEEHGGRVVDLDEAALAHVEEAELTGGSEAVLDAAQDAEGVVAVTLERAHDIDEVLEDARAREAAVLGHVADEDECRTGAPGGLGEQRRTLAHLSDRARRRPEPRVAHGLDRVDRDHSRRNGVEVAGDRGDGLLVDHVQAAVDSPEALGPLAHLRLGLLGRDEQRRGAGAGCRGERLQHQRRLADTGLAAEQERRTRHEPAAEDAVELADAGRPVRDLGRRHLGERDGRVAPTLGHERRELGVEGLDTARTHR